MWNTPGGGEVLGCGVDSRHRVNAFRDVSIDAGFPIGLSFVTGNSCDGAWRRDVHALRCGSAALMEADTSI